MYKVAPMFRHAILAGPALAAALVLAGCGGPGDEAAPTPAASDGVEEAMPVETAAISEEVPSALPPMPEAVATQPPSVPHSPPPATVAAPVPATPVAAAPVPPPTPPQAFATCRACHSVEPGKNGVGPTLAGIMGTKAGDVAGFNFSPALKASGIVWNRQTLDTWLAGPMKMVPGTKMVMSVPNAEARASIIDYLEKLK